MTGKGRSGRFATITILIGILSAFVFAGRAHPGPIAIVLPYDGTVWNNPPSSPTPGVIHGTYHSAVMNVDVGYNIYLPPQYATNPTQSFPVIYWLHGGQSQDENFDVPTWKPLLDSAVRSGRLPPMIMVWANCGHNAKYMDAAVGSSMYGVLMVETTIIGELIPHIDATYRTIASPQGRAIQGGSGGGMGALRFAFKYPQMFSSVFGFDPAVDDNASNVMVNEPELMAAMFNNDPNLFDQNTVFTLANNNAANIRGLAIHIAIGSLDGLLPYNQDLFATLDRLGIPHDPLEIINGADHSNLVLPNKIENLQFAAKYFVPRGRLPDADLRGGSS
jgi:enterochelin esterase-like enzyme